MFVIPSMALLSRRNSTARGSVAGGNKTSTDVIHDNEVAALVENDLVFSDSPLAGRQGQLSNCYPHGSGSLMRNRLKRSLLAKPVDVVRRRTPEEAPVLAQALIRHGCTICLTPQSMTAAEPVIAVSDLTRR